MEKVSAIEQGIKATLGSNKTLNWILFPNGLIILALVILLLMLQAEGIALQHLTKKNYKYFGYLFSIAIFILFSNLFGLFPYSYTLTSQILITLFFSIIIFGALTIIANLF